jgi:steroid 5-alpha reductase family enzyme
LTGTSIILISLLLGVTGLWVVSLLKKDASIIDRFWGLLFVYLSGVYAFIFGVSGWRALLILTLVSIWGARLSLHIHLRNRKHTEDIRYARMREEHGSSFWWYSYFSIFLLQGVLALLISAPLFSVFSRSSPSDFLWSDAIGIALWTTGFIFETLGDWQLKKFKSNPTNKGRLLTTGLWSLTRHPNYFGDACLWWGFYFFALSVNYGWVTLFGPLIMTLFLRFVSGVSLLEKDLKNSKPGYEEYIKQTPAFFPRVWTRKGNS